jgi:MYXO-CTERM domain-containing protein
MSFISRSRWLRHMRGVGAVRTVAIGAVAAMTAGMALCSPTGASASAPGAAAPVKSGVRVAIPASVHPFAEPSADVGRMDPATKLHDVSLLFRMSPQQKSASAALQMAQLDPTSPKYHQWLTPEQVAAQFGASPADVSRATAWLRSQGLTVTGPSRTSQRLAFSGTVAQVEQAFGTEMHNYVVDGERHFAASIAPSVPAELADLVMGVHNLHDFRLKAPVHPMYPLPLPGADGGLTPYPTMAPADFAKIYGLDALYAKNITGTGQHIAIAGQTDFNDADIANFRTTFSLSTTGSTTCQGTSAICPVRHLVPDSGNAFFSAGDITESELDLEWSGAVAPDATIDFVFTGDNSAGGVFDAMLYAVEQKIAPIVSVSYGGGENTLSPADAVFNESLGDAAAMMGITMLAAAGDTGAADGDSQRSKAARHGEVVDWPGSIPTFVSVGGTQFQLTQSNLSTYLDGNYNALGYVPESGWNETWADEDAGYYGLGAGGGGVSQIFAKPYWQQGVTPNDNFRDVPDVALSASAEIYPYVVSYSWTAADGDAQAPQPEALTAIGGTSAAAPSFAGILALVNQSLAAANPSAPVGLGNANPVIYALANNAATKGAFNDITTGNNIVPCTPGSPSCPASPPYQFGYSAGPGYDQVTGNGSINASAFVAAWSALTPTSTALTVNASGMTEGSTLMLSATVASKATSNALTGDVTFYFETFDAMGNPDLSGVLGSVAITPSTSGNEGGTAQLTAKAPAGLLQPDAGLNGGSKIGAIYGGDIHYLASWSALSQVTATATLAICPQSVTLEPLQTGFKFLANGGSTPINWGIYNDSTCARETVPGPDGGPTRVEVCSSINDAGVFTAGPAAGVAQVVAIDSNNAYVSAYVTVAGSADGGAPLPPGCTVAVADAGSDASTASDSGSGEDATAPEMDATADGGSSKNGGGSSGCSCTTAGGQGGTALGGLGGALLGLAAMVRRKRSRR